jgi:DNA-binding LacI/PurR family transcriptional regulator
MSQAELARLAFDALLSEVEREEPLPEGSEYVLKTALIERESTAISRESAVSKTNHPAPIRTLG